MIHAVIQSVFLLISVGEYKYLIGKVQIRNIWQWKILFNLLNRENDQDSVFVTLLFIKQSWGIATCSNTSKYFRGHTVINHFPLTLSKINGPEIFDHYKVLDKIFPHGFMVSSYWGSGPGDRSIAGAFFIRTLSRKLFSNRKIPSPWKEIILQQEIQHQVSRS
jgi:hypothetical protein